MQESSQEVLLQESESNGKKIPAHRRAEIRRLLGDQEAMSIPEISAALGVSPSTVRRDLDALDKKGVVRRSHGGAVTVEPTAFEFRFKERRLHNPAEKVRIGKYAVGLLEAGQSIIFDSSSTVLAAAEILLRRPMSITAVTNDVGVAYVLAETSSVSVVVPGGEIRGGSLTLLGPYTQTLLDGLHVDVALMGIHAITGEVLSDSSLAVVEAKQAMMRAARRVILLADHGKFGPPAFFDVANLDDIDDLVTDAGTPTAMLEEARASGRLRVHVV